MIQAIKPLGTQVTHRDDAMTIIAMLALVCIVGYVVSPSMLGHEMPYTGGAAVAVGIGAVACDWLSSRVTRIATACVVVGVVLVRLASVLLPDVFVRQHGALSLPDSAGIIILLAAAIMMLLVAIKKR